MKKIRLGVIGGAPGNGHPYSWSAIFNGYNLEFMKDCPFPVIPDYLSKQKFPDDFLVDYGLVNSIWTQDVQLSDHVAKSSRIENVCSNIGDLTEHSDAILLARDDAERHLEMASVFLNRGMPIFIDKPFALNIADAESMISLQKYETQIFTCSSLRFAEELQLTETERIEIGELKEIEAFCPKYWETYSVHLIEPILLNCAGRGNLLAVDKVSMAPWHTVLIKWKNLKAKINMTKDEPRSIEITFRGTRGSKTKTFRDSFNCFKKSLLSFVTQIHEKQQLIAREDTLEIVSIIENGK